MRFSSVGLKRLKGPDRLSKMGKTRHRVLIADDDTPFARKLCDYMTLQGFECRVTATISESKQIVEYWQPDSVFIDLMLPETNALSLCKFIKSKSLKKIPKIIVMSKQSLPQGIETMRRAGASHYLIKPFSLEEACNAVATNPTQPESDPVIGAATIKELHLLNLFLKQTLLGSADMKVNLHHLMRMISLKVHAMRCSFIQVLNEEAGLVLASNDDETVQGLPLHLAQYPEVLEVRRTGVPLVIPNIRTSDILAPVKESLARTPFETFAVFPVFCRGQFYGVLSLRMEQKDRVAMCYVEKFGQVCSQIISLAIGSSPP